MFDDSETVEDYVMLMRGMAVHLTMLGEEVKDDEIITNML
jgi:predicted SpoU family rRNA methylase